MTFLVRCSKCGKMYKCTKVNNTHYITDFGDNVTERCLECNQINNPVVIKTSDWIADLVFTIKGK